MTEISNATNKQTPVINADRFANEIFHQNIQKKIFEKYGLLFERKRGEFFDGLNHGYIEKENIVERNLFFRIFYSSNGSIQKGVRKKLFQRNDFIDININDDISFDKFYIGFKVYKELNKDLKPSSKILKSVYAKLFAYVENNFHHGVWEDGLLLSTKVQKINAKWKEFLLYKREDPRWIRKSINKITGEPIINFLEASYMDSSELPDDISKYFNSDVKGITSGQPN